jgi:hypothetical protein
MVRYFPILGFGPVLGLGFRVRNLEKKRKRNWTCSIWVLSVLKVFGGLGLDMLLVVREVLVGVCSPEGGGMPEGVPEP